MIIMIVIAVANTLRRLLVVAAAVPLQLRIMAVSGGEAPTPSAPTPSAPTPSPTIEQEFTGKLRMQMPISTEMDSTPQHPGVRLSCLYGSLRPSWAPSRVTPPLISRFWHTCVDSPTKRELLIRYKLLLLESTLHHDRTFDHHLHLSIGELQLWCPLSTEEAPLRQLAATHRRFCRSCESAS